MLTYIIIQFSECPCKFLQYTQLMTTLEEFHQQFALSIGVADFLHATSATDKLKKVFQLWLSGKSPLPPTWRSLYQVLRELNLKEMIQDIEECLAGKWLMSTV